MASLVVALVAVGVAIAAWLRPVPESSPPPPPSEPTYSDQQIAKAKANVCEAYNTVSHAVLVNTHRPNPVPGDDVGALAAAANGRLALYAGGDYLLDRLAANPAAPGGLVKAIRSLANQSKEIGIAFLADEPDSVQEPLRRALDADVATIDGLCQ
ncbi:hypothetical protein E2F47_26035 [Mycobacterium eburneum]|nr:hypothetical protein E2F47_26035 [Mycobacterium eburneum]